MKIILILILISNLSYGQGNGLYEFESENGKIGFIDKTGKIKIKAEYFRVGCFSEGLCNVSLWLTNKEEKRIFIDTLGNQVFGIKNNLSVETVFSNGFARISNHRNHWFVNKKGENEFGKTWVDAYGKFENGIAYVSNKEFSDFYPINIKGVRVSDKTFSKDEIWDIRKNDTLESKNKIKFKSDKYIPFQENKLWGFKDSSNNVVIKPLFYKIDKFKNGVCAVRIKKVLIVITGDYFFDALIDENGKVLIEKDMHCYGGFQGELIKFYGQPHFGGGIYYLDKNGQEIIPRE